jgi:hypothetical protein
VVLRNERHQTNQAAQSPKAARREAPAANEFQDHQVQTEE